MAKKSKARAGAAATKKNRVSAAKTLAKSRTRAKTNGATGLKSEAAPENKKRASSGLRLTLPLARAKKLAGDLYEAAGLALWAEAIEAASESKKTDLIALQDSICDAADFLREAKATNPRHLQLFLVACLDRHGLPSTAPRFITAADQEEALAIWREAFKGEFGRRRPHAWPAPALGSAPGLHE